MRLHTDRQLFKDAINFASRPATDGQCSKEGQVCPRHTA